MTRVIPINDVRYTPAVAVLECGDDAPISFYVTEFERGDGTPLHLHPYPEVFLVERNTALFTAGDHELTVTDCPRQHATSVRRSQRRSRSRRKRAAERQGRADEPLSSGG